MLNRIELHAFLFKIAVCFVITVDNTAIYISHRYVNCYYTRNLEKICHKRLDSSIYLSQYFISHVIMTILQGAGHKLNVAACLCFSQLKSFPALRTVTYSTT